MNNSSKRIYIDFDDVLCETALAFIDIAREAFGRQVAFEDIHSFNLWEAFDLTQDEYEHLMDLGHKDAFLASLLPIAGAREVISEWVEAGLQVTIVTGRPPSCASVSTAWLTQYAFPVTEIVFVDKYGRNDPADNSISPKALGRLEFALAVEDAPAMVQHLVEHTSFPVVVYDRPWNRDFPTNGPPRPGQAARAMNWVDLGHNWREWTGC